MPEYQYLVDNPAFPYCAGCGHTWINKALDGALQKLQVKPTKVNLVSDIGCVGLVDKLFLTNTIHTTHGRSTAFATGLQLADEILYDNDAIHIIMIGDGGATIGLLHLIEAAKYNANITVLLHNNFVYGMTGGQNSGLTPENFRTATTMGGSITPGLHIVHLLEAAQAGYLSRKLATDKDLDDAIKEAIEYPGFALVEVIELCTGYATKWNKMAKTDVQEILENMDAGKLGLINKQNRESYGTIYKRSFPVAARKESFKTINVDRTTKLDAPISVVLAGSAGEGVQFATKILSEACVQEGLNVIQTNDNPVTIGTGFSISELSIDSNEIYYTGITPLDYLLISSYDGLGRAKEYINKVIKDNNICNVIIDETLINDFGKFSQNKSNFKMHSYPFRKLAPDSMNINIMLMGYLLKIEKQFSLEAFNQSLTKNMSKPEKALKAIESGHSL